MGGLSKYYCSVNKAHSRAVFKNNGKVLWGWAKQTMSLNTRGVLYFACLSGRKLSVSRQEVNYCRLIWGGCQVLKEEVLANTKIPGEWEERESILSTCTCSLYLSPPRWSSVNMGGDVTASFCFTYWGKQIHCIKLLTWSLYILRPVTTTATFCKLRHHHHEDQQTVSNSKLSFQWEKKRIQTRDLTIWTSK